MKFKGTVQFLSELGSDVVLGIGNVKRITARPDSARSELKFYIPFGRQSAFRVGRKVEIEIKTK